MLHTISLKYNLKSGMGIGSGECYSFCSELLDYSGSFALSYEMNFLTLKKFSEEWHWDFDWDCKEPIDCIVKMGIFAY